MTRLGLSAFTPALRQPRARTDRERPRSFEYARLARVSLWNSYYNTPQDAGACSDFVFWPTPTTAELMYDLGLLFRNEVTGFSVLYDQRHTSDLIDYLRRQEAPEPQPAGACCPAPGEATGRAGWWTRLSFVLALDNPQFMNFTDLPIGLNPSDYNIYFTNQQAHGPGRAGVVLNPGPYVAVATPLGRPPKPRESRVLRLVDTQFVAEAWEQVACVRVVDVQGAVVACRPRCVRRMRADRPPVLECTDRIYLDFATLPLGRYTIEWLGADGEALLREERLHTVAYPVPLCFVDLFFSNPTGGAPGIYPVLDLDGDAEIVPVDYHLRFRERSTAWNYYVVPRDGRQPENLRIEGSAAFGAPTPVVLANGQSAYRFTSLEPLVLEAASPYRLSLHGRLGGPRDTALVDPLPVAAPAQVVAERQEQATPDGPRHGTRADIYVYV